MNKPSLSSQFATRLATESSRFLSSTFFEMSQNKEQKRTKQKLYFFTNPKILFYYFCSIHAKTNGGGKKFKKYTFDASN